jgi:hypothetical protein
MLPPPPSTQQQVDLVDEQIRPRLGGRLMDHRFHSLPEFPAKLRLGYQ